MVALLTETRLNKGDQKLKADLTEMNIKDGIDVLRRDRSVIELSTRQSVN